MAQSHTRGRPLDSSRHFRGSAIDSFAFLPDWGNLSSRAASRPIESTCAAGETTAMFDRSAEPVRDEINLVKRMLSGDVGAFETFSDHYIPAIHRFASSKLIGRRELALEISQQTVCKVMAKLGTWRGEGPLTAWLFACVRNEIAMHFRGAENRPRELGLDDDGVPMAAIAAPARSQPDQQLLTAETAERVHIVLDILDSRYASAIEWKYVEGLPVREIARRLSLSEKAAESLLTRARCAFRMEYQRLEGESLPMQHGENP